MLYRLSNMLEQCCKGDVTCGSMLHQRWLHPPFLEFTRTLLEFFRIQIFNVLCFSYHRIYIHLNKSFIMFCLFFGFSILLRSPVLQFQKWCALPTRKCIYAWVNLFLLIDVCGSSISVGFLKNLRGPKNPRLQLLQLML